MCRMLCVHSLHPQPIKKYIAETETSLLTQATIGKHFDGWGIGYYHDQHPVILKTSKSITKENLQDLNALSSPLFLAHIRKATNPLDVETEELITEKNAHPFTYKDYTFAHNGTLKIAKEVKKHLGSYGEHLEANNDSEILFRFILKLAEEKKGFTHAFLHLEQELNNIYETLKEPPLKPFTSLNCILTNGNIIYAYNRFLKQTKKKANCSQDPYYVMQYYHDEEKLIISSERLFNGEWKPIGNGFLLEAQSTTEGISINKIELPKLHFIHTTPIMQP